MSRNPFSVFDPRWKRLEDSKHVNDGMFKSLLLLIYYTMSGILMLFILSLIVLYFIS